MQVAGPDKLIKVQLLQGRWYNAGDGDVHLGLGRTGPTNKEAGYHPATTQLPPGYRLATLATIGNQAVAAPHYL